MSDEIKADYDQLDEVASRFANQSQAIAEMLGRVRGSMNPLEEGGWIGAGSDAFFQEMNSEILPASQRLQTVLDEAGQVTKAIVELVKQAEDEACAPFQSS